MPENVPVAARYIINAKGQWLRADFAAAYLRAQADGCPEGGVSGMGAGRTQQDQEYLHDQYLHHGGPLAAWPWWTSNHIGGTALDISTGTPAQRWLSTGGRWDYATPGEKIRANEYGMVRTVNGAKHNEPWHFAYNRSLDKHRAADLASRLKVLGYGSVRNFQQASGLEPDGVDGPLTWAALLGAKAPVTPTPVPDPTPAPVGPVDFRAGSYNAQLQRFGGGSYGLDAAFVDDVLRPSVLMAQEVDESARDSIRVATGFKVYPLNTVALFWDPAKYSWGDRIEVDLGTAYHGLIATTLTSKRNGQSFVAASVHIRPRAAFKSDAAAKAGKLADVARVIAALRNYPRVVVGGDWSSDARALMEKAGYQLVTPYVDTYDKAGVQHIDAIYARGIDDRTGGSEHPTSASDHDGLVANLTLPALASSL